MSELGHYGSLIALAAGDISFQQAAPGQVPSLRQQTGSCPEVPKLYQSLTAGWTDRLFRHPGYPHTQLSFCSSFQSWETLGQSRPARLGRDAGGFSVLLCTLKAYLVPNSFLPGQAGAHRPFLPTLAPHPDLTPGKGQSSPRMERGLRMRVPRERELWLQMPSRENDCDGSARG